MHRYNFFCSGTKLHQVFIVERGRDRSRSATFLLVDMKLRKIAPNFGRFLPAHILRGQSPQKLYPLDHARLAACRPEKPGEVAPPNPKVIGAHTPNFKPIFECSSLTIVGGDPRPQWGVR